MATAKARKYHNRRGLLAKVHIAKKDLGLPDDLYRDTLDQLFGVRSSGDLTNKQLSALLDHFSSKGWQSGLKVDDPMIRKMRSLWHELADAGGVKNRSEKALRAFAKKLTRKDHFEWMSTAEATLVIESLKKWLERLEG